jgi:hypothetical protein
MFWFSSLFLVFCRLLKKNYSFKGKIAKFGRKLEKNAIKIGLSAPSCAQVHVYSIPVGLHSSAPTSKAAMHECYAAKEETHA